MAEIPITTLRKWIAALDPKEALSNLDPRYVDLDAGPGARKGDGDSCTEELQRTILLSEVTGSSCQLFTGFPGSGKTTELNRLEKRFVQDHDDPTYVVRVDAEQYMDPFVAPSITDLLRVLAFTLDAEARRCAGKDPNAADGYGRRIWNWLQSDVEIKEVGLEGVGVNLMAEIKANPDFRRKAEEHLASNFQAFATEARLVVAEAVNAIRTHARADRVVVLVDGLEKFQPLRPEDSDSMERAVEAVFHQHAAWLALPCHVIYTFPYWLRWRTVGLGQAHDSTPVVLPMVKTHARDGSDFDAGLALLAELVGRRLDLTLAFGPDPTVALHPLLRASGGYPKDVVRLVRDTLRTSRSFPVTRETSERVIRRLAEEYELVALRSDPRVLAHIRSTHGLPQGEDGLRSAGRLIQLFLVLTYRNGHDWYDLHPLVAGSPRVKEWLSGE